MASMFVLIETFTDRKPTVVESYVESLRIPLVKQTKQPFMSPDVTFFLSVCMQSNINNAYFMIIM